MEDLILTFSEWGVEDDSYNRVGEWREEHGRSPEGFIFYPFSGGAMHGVYPAILNIHKYL